MKRLSLIVSAVVYIVVFLWGYSAVVVPAFANTGFTYRWPGIETMTWVITLSLVPLLVIPTELSKPSVLIVWWIYITTYVPSMLMPVVILAIPDSTLFPLQMCVLCTMLLLCAVPRAKTLVLPKIVVSPTLFWWTLGLSWAACVAFSLFTISPAKILANFALLLSGGSEYTIRADLPGGRALGYIDRQLSQALDPFLIAYGLLSRRRWMIAAGVFVQLVYFGQTGMKEVLVAILLIGFVYMFLKKFRRNFGLLLLAGITGMVILSTVVDLATHTALVSAQTTRRTLAGPGQLTGFYFEHFSTAPHPGHSFGTSNFQFYGPPREIGLYYFGSEYVDANANFWAEGFAEYGVAGIFAFTLVIAVMLWIYDSIAAKRSFELAVLLAVPVADALTNSSPLTILVTHGGIAVGVLLYFSPKIEQARKVKWRLRPKVPAFLGGRTAASMVRP